MLESFILLLKLCQEIYNYLQGKRSRLSQFHKVEMTLFLGGWKVSKQRMHPKVLCTSNTIQRERLDILTLKITTSNTSDYCIACFAEYITNYIMVYIKRPSTCHGNNQSKRGNKENAKRTQLSSQSTQEFREWCICNFKRFATHMNCFLKSYFL